MKPVQYIIFVFTIVFSVSSCKKFIEIDPPRTDLIKSTVFTSHATANAAMMDIYYEMNRTGFASGSSTSITYFATYSSDEQVNYSIQFNQEFNDNELAPDNPFILSLWSEMYKTIYKANAVIEGVAASQNISENLKKQLEGEAKFIRAFCHFYLVNLWGNVPLITTTDYRTNAAQPRTPTAEVYQQIIADLKDAQTLLPDNYAHANNERVRANKGTATALLARVNLHIGDWANAETEATKIIQNTVLYGLIADLNAVFRKNNTEAIFQLHNTFLPGDFLTFRVFSDGPSNGAFRPEFINNFELNDQRLTSWVRSITAVNGITYFFPGKYKFLSIGAEYSTIFRLAEQYLIRAEARAQLNNISGAQADLNVIRSRAGLGNTSAGDKPSLITAIEHERIVELFTEQGLRWLDLKRTGRADAVLAPIKGSTWQSTDVLYPIPEYQILNSSLTQNAGY